MSALATELAPGVHTPGARPFENMPDDLALVGVNYSAEQIEFLNLAATFRPGWWRKMYALTIAALPDPVHPHSEALGIPAFTLDEEWEARPVVVPCVAEIDCSEWETFDEQEPVWRRFPSVLGRRHLYSPHTGTLLEGLQPIRLWHCLPLEEEDVGMVKEALQDWITEEWKPYTTWLEVRDNADTSACDGYAEVYGIEDTAHQHEYDERGDLIVCRDGESWFEGWGSKNILLDQDGDPYPRPFAPVGGLYDLTHAWQNLVISSQANTRAALKAYPSWMRDDVARTERHYSPWLWSS